MTASPLGLEVAVLRGSVEARAGLHGIENVVTHDQGLGKLSMKLFEQLAHRKLLGLGAGVGRATFGVQAAFVADANRVAVVVLAMGTNHIVRATVFNGAVAANHLVVAATFPTVGAMPAVDVLNRALLPRTHCGAVDDDKCDNSHNG